MSKHKQVLSSVVCALLLSAGLAQAAGGASLTARQVVDKNVAARGGLTAWRAVKSLSMTGNMDAGKVDTRSERERVGGAQAVRVSRRVRPEPAAPGTDTVKVVQVPFVMELQRPRKMRLEIRFRGETAVQVYDGVAGWKLRPFLERRDVEPYTAEELKVAAQQQELDGPLVDYAAKGSKIALEGVEPVEGRPAYKLKVTLKDGQVRRVWVDTETFLDVKIDGTRQLGGKPRTVATYLRDYKTVDGVKVPFAMETKVDGVSGSEKIHIEQVALNPKIADARFAKPL
jgi:hypothetical protein